MSTCFSGLEPSRRSRSTNWRRVPGFRHQVPLARRIWQRSCKQRAPLDSRARRQRAWQETNSSRHLSVWLRSARESQTLSLRSAPKLYRDGFFALALKHKRYRGKVSSCVLTECTHVSTRPEAKATKTAFWQNCRHGKTQGRHFTR